MIFLCCCVCIGKCLNAKINVKEEVIVWGSGQAMREFLYVDDMAEASLFVLELDRHSYQSNTEPMLSHINIGTGVDVTILELAKIMKKVVGFEGDIKFDINKPDGTMRKLIDTSRLSRMGWTYSTELENGLRKTYDWYVKTIEQSKLISSEKIFN